MKITKFEGLQCWQEARTLVNIFEKIYNQAEKVSKLDSGFITYLLQNEKRYGNTKKLKKPN